MSLTAEWAAHRGKMVWAQVGNLMFAGLAVLWTIQFGIAVAEGRYLYASFYLPAAVAAWSACFAVITMGLLFFRDEPHRRSGASTNSGTVIGYSSAFAVCISGFYLGVAVAAPVFAVGLWSERLSFPMTDGQSALFPIGALFGGIVFLLVIVWFATGCARWPYVRADSRRVTIGSYRYRQSIEWSEVAQILPIMRGSQPCVMITFLKGSDPTYEAYLPIAVGKGDKRRQPMVVRADTMASGAQPLLRFLRYYHAQPDKRTELDDGRALARLGRR